MSVKDTASPWKKLSGTTPLVQLPVVFTSHKVSLPVTPPPHTRLAGAPAGVMRMRGAVVSTVQV